MNSKNDSDFSGADYTRDFFFETPDNCCDLFSFIRALIQTQRTSNI